MRWRWVMIVAAGAAVAWCGPLAAGGTADAVLAGAAGSWRHAIEVPGLGTLNAGGEAGVRSVSCGSAGNCAAGGFYTGSVSGQAFVAVERNGRWGKAARLPGLAALNAGGDAQVSGVSCPSAGNCAAGGFYADAKFHLQAFVASERSGRWDRAVEVPGSAALNAGRSAQVSSVSCASAGNCAAGGFYRDGSRHFQAFVVTERNGRWRRAVEVPGSGVLNAGGRAEVSSVSCPSAGNCAAGGFYSDGSGHNQAFVAVERDGRWRRAVEVPGLGALNPGGFARGLSVSCGSAGNCAAGGFYSESEVNVQAFVVSERNGRWGKAIQVPGSGGLNVGGDAESLSVSCASAGSCAAGGFYTDGSPASQAFVVSERNGLWGKAVEVPGSGALNAGGDAEVSSVSCASAGNCAAGGFYTDGSLDIQAFVASERNGRWGGAIEVPGSGALNAGGDGGVNSVSCPSAGNCAAGGLYVDGSGHIQGFVVSQT